jgi:ATP phosphoribosyltransferase regulatory subunit
MNAEAAETFAALEGQAQRLVGVFSRAGFEFVAPAVIQPAGLFLDVVGESLRARTYVFTDPDGQELCLRPDLTVPTCRLHLERHADPATPARYCYNGAAFRYQPANADRGHPREFRQAGLEAFGDVDAEAADAEILALTVEALRSVGIATARLRIGDLGLFDLLIGRLGLPDRWGRRLRNAFGRPDAFRRELKRLVENPGEAAARLPADLRAKLARGASADAEAAITAHLDANDIELIGTRGLDEMTAALAAIVADASHPALSRATADLIERYLAIRAAPRDVPLRVTELLSEHGIDLADGLARFTRRLNLAADQGVDMANAEFSAEFGRNLAYYTGFVFELIADELGHLSPVAGGGRYDRMLRTVGATIDVPAVGASIHTERVLSLAGARAP